MVNQGWEPDELDDGPPQWIRVGISMSATGGAAAAPGIAGPTPDRLDAFCRALASRIGIPVTAQGFTDYRALLSAINRGDADLAWLPPLVALRSASAGRTLPIVLPIRNGAAWYSTAMFSRQGSGITSMREVAGVRAAWVDQQSTAGYLVLRAWLRAQGMDLGLAFVSEQFCGSHSGVVRAVLSGQADVGATYAHLDGTMTQVRTAGWGEAAVHILAMAGPIPNDVLAASIRLPVSTIRTIRDVLVNQDEKLHAASSALFNTQGFISAETEHMAPLMKLLKHLDDTGRRTTSIFPPAR